MALRQRLNGLPPGLHEAPVEIELIGSLTLAEFLKVLKDAYKEAGPRFCAIPTPQWKLADLKRDRASNKKVAGAEGGPKGAMHRIILRRPVLIKSSNPKKNATIDLEQVMVKHVAMCAF